MYFPLPQRKHQSLNASSGRSGSYPIIITDMVGMQTMQQAAILCFCGAIKCLAILVKQRLLVCLKTKS
jgi:hypothetical protein